MLSLDGIFFVWIKLRLSRAALSSPNAQHLMALAIAHHIPEPVKTYHKFSRTPFSNCTVRHSRSSIHSLCATAPAAVGSER